MSTTARGKPRPRRIAADEAHSWARNLRLHQPLGKLVLTMLSGYVNGDGVCWVSQDALAYDCELAHETVRKRLLWLEKVGAIARSPRWVDVNGVRNADGRGKRTTDDIKLLLFADVDRIEELAQIPENQLEAYIAGSNSPDSTPETAESGAEISPPRHGGQIPGAPQPAPQLAPQQPPTCVGASDSSEPEPEPESPQPLRGEGEPGRDLEEPDDFAPAWSSWPGHEVMRRDLALAEFRLLSRDKQRLCRAAIPQFVRMQERLGRTRPPNFHLWIRNAGFEEFPNATLETAAAAASTSFDVNSAEGRAIKALYAFARTALFENRGRVIYPLPVTAQVLAFADLPDRSTWHWIEDRGPIAAWSTFLQVHIHRSHPELMMTRGSGVESRRGIFVPWPWPPRKDGTISPEATGDAA